MSEYPDSVDGRVIATVHLTDDATTKEENRVISRLDDGNDYPGLQVQRVDGTLYVTSD